MTGSQLHVVFGHGQVGSQLVDRLLAHGARVRTVRRSPERSRHAAHETVQADAFDREATIRAAAGATVVYHCANAPYHLWPTQLPPLYRNIAAGAQAARARLVVLDNVYAVGATGTFDEDTPEQPCSRKGVIRKELADELRAMHARGDLAVTIGRASDFFGPGADNTTLLHPREIEQLLSAATVDVLGDIDQPHSWSYTPDVAAGLFALGLHPELAGPTLHLPVLPAQSGRSLLEALAAELRPPLRTRRMPGWLLKVAGWFSPQMRELPEMQYQFERPFVMPDARIRGLLPIRPTPLEEQIRATASWLRARLSSRTSCCLLPSARAPVARGDDGATFDLLGREEVGLDDGAALERDARNGRIPDGVEPRERGRVDLRARNRPENFANGVVLGKAFPYSGSARCLREDESCPKTSSRSVRSRTT